MKLSNRTLASVGVLALAAPLAVSAAVVNLNGIADGSTAYYEQSSDAFFRMDLVEAPPNETQQRFRLISNPSVAIGNPAFDGFPNDADFRLGSVTYDESMLVGGSGTATITGVSLGIGAQPGNPAYINFGRWTDITTTVDTFTGTVDVINNQPVAMNLDTTVTVTAFSGAIVATGEFDVVDDFFAGQIATPFGAPQTIWDLSGTLTTVPEPTALGLLAIGAALTARRRR